MTRSADDPCGRQPARRGLCLLWSPPWKKQPAGGRVMPPKIACDKMTEGSRPFGIRRLDVPIFGPFRPIGNSTPSKPAPTATHKRTPTARAAEDARALADLNKRASSLLFDIMVLENRREKAALAAMEEPEHRVIIDRMGNIRGA